LRKKALGGVGLEKTEAKFLIFDDADFPICVFSVVTMCRS